MNKQHIKELIETLEEMKRSEGTATEQETADYILKFINVLLAQE